MSTDHTETMAAIVEAITHYRLDNLNGYTSRDDLATDAWILLADGTAATPADAVRLAHNAAREARGADGTRIGFAYFSQVIHEQDGGTITMGERVAATFADQGEGEGRGGDYTQGDLLAAVEATRNAKTERAHGWANAARGRANGSRGVANDATILAAVEAVGGRHYGYAAKVVAALTADGWTTNANAVRVAVHRAIRRTEGGDHSANGR